MLTIYSEHIGSRLRYTCQCLFEDILDVPVHLTDDLKVLTDSAAGLNYSNTSIDGFPFIRPHSLLFETGIRSQNVKLGTDGGFMHTASDISAHDVFASSFYLLSRYEEYVDTSRDKYGRFTSRQSIMGKAQLLHRPLVDIWANELYKALRKAYPSLPESQKKFRQLSTFDIDVAYAYKGRNWWRRTRSSLQDLKNLNFSRIKERKKVLKGEVPDPFDTYAYLKDFHTLKKVDAHVFFLMGDYGPLDKSLSTRRKEFKELFSTISTWAECGIHPSMGSNNNPKRFLKELKRFKKLSGKKTDLSRQHFLFLKLPETYRQLISRDIEIDFSMGYADHTGFRAGTSHPFPWYDLLKEECTKLYLMPLSAMDASLMDYQGLSIEEAKNHLAMIKNEVRAVNGSFVSLWHNNTVSDYGEWKGWRAVFESMF